MVPLSMKGPLNATSLEEMYNVLRSFTKGHHGELRVGALEGDCFMLTNDEDRP